MINQKAEQNLLDRLIAQLDTLVPFLGLAHEEVFDLIHSQNEFWFPQQPDALPETLIAYQHQVSNSAFLLGYSYFEAFIADLAREALKCRPNLLSGNSKIEYSDIVDLGDYESVIDHMVEKQVFSITRRFKNIIDYFEKKLISEWPLHEGRYVFLDASLIRNSLMHNGGFVNERMGNELNMEIGSEIKLNPDDVHDYGIQLRELAYDLYDEVSRRHFQ